MFKEVTKDQFYAKIGPLDAIVNVSPENPHEVFFKLRYGKVLGKIIGFDDSKYFLTA
jgi:hypothetical protein